VGGVSADTNTFCRIDWRNGENLMLILAHIF